MDKLLGFLKRDRVKNCILGFVSFMSLVLGVVGIVSKTPEVSWIIVLGVVIFCGLLGIASVIYETLLFRKIDAANRKCVEHKKSLDSTNEFINKILYYEKYVIGALDRIITKIRRMNHGYLRRQERTNEIEILCANADESTKREITSKIKSSNADNLNEHRESMIGEYNNFLTDILRNLKNILDERFKARGLQLRTAITIKQFNRVVTDIKDIANVTIITTFRDNQMYYNGEREIGKCEFDIDKNTAFSHCLEHKYFRLNNIDPRKDNYKNQTANFKDFYNCTIVAPITCDNISEKDIYGYLTCDTLNDDLLNLNIFDDTMINIMTITANIIGMYFDNVNTLWKTASLPSNFLGTIYQAKLNKEQP